MQAFVLDVSACLPWCCEDAAYLDLAMRLGIPLATQDDALRKAANAAGIILVQA
jgi:predicted nucleic acid-binding protein